MREIKFRAWDLVASKMRQVTQLEFNTADELCSVEITNGLENSRSGFEESFAQRPDGEDLVLMQYTGLKDKNGKEIYEGDILQAVYQEDEGGGWHSDTKVRGAVYFDPYWGVKFDCRDHTQRTAEYWKNISPTWRECHNVEIIGNIYENPELLKS